MKLLKWLLILVAVLAAVVFGGGMFLKDDVHVERSITIDRSPAEVYAVVASMPRFNQWSPWRDYDPTAKQEVSGPSSGVGGKLTWAGEKGGGTMEIVGVVQDAQVTTSLDFGPEGKATANYLLVPEGSGTKVTWTFDSDFEGNLIGRWFGLMMDSMLGPDYERGLKDLKALVESAPPPAAPAAPEAPEAPAEDEQGMPEDSAEPAADAEAAESA